MSTLRLVPPDDNKWSDDTPAEPVSARLFVQEMRAMRRRVIVVESVLAIAILILATAVMGWVS